MGVKILILEIATKHYFEKTKSTLIITLWFCVVFFKKFNRLYVNIIDTLQDIGICISNSLDLMN